MISSNYHCANVINSTQFSTFDPKRSSITIIIVEDKVNFYLITKTISVRRSLILTEGYF